MNGRASWPDVAFLAEESLPYTLDSPVFLGDPAIWTRVTQGEPALALLSSTKAPAGVLLAVHDLARQWRRHGPIIISGFHAPVENEALSVLSRGDWPLVLVLARGLYRRPPAHLHSALEDAFRRFVTTVGTVTSLFRGKDNFSLFFR